jgi:hypothetical protein
MSTRNENPLTLDEALAGRKGLYSNSGVLTLNIILSIVQLSSYATGYDGSMMSEMASFYQMVDKILIETRWIANLELMAIVL